MLWNRQCRGNSRPPAPTARPGARDRAYHKPMVDQALVERARSLEVAERVELINELWASIDQEALPVTPDEAALIDQRLAEADANPLAGRSWEDVEATLRARLS